MHTLIEEIDSGKLWDFPGGIHPPENKELSNQTPIDLLPLPERFYVPVSQHIGQPGSLLVKIGDQVKRGQPLTQPEGMMSLPVHAPTSGTIEAIGQWDSAHPSGLPELTITLRADGKDEWCQRRPISSLEQLSREQIQDKIRLAGIAGLGGATFPSHIKLAPAKPVEVLLINAAECEPYITADDTLMREFAAEIIQGIRVLDTLLTPKRILFGIEDNKPQAIAAIEQAIRNSGYDANHLQVRVIPTKYPSGSEKQLIQVLTGREVPSGKIPAELGMVMQNVGSVFAIKRAIFNDEPLIERVVTVTGERTKQPGNYWVRLGTPIDWLLEQTRFKPQLFGQKVIMGGPMMGFTLPSLKAPVIKSTNCLLLPSKKELPGNARELACIRCGECAKACPAQLQPQELYWHARAQELDKAQAQNLLDCIECGACAYVCPSDIPLVQYYRIAKSAIRHDQQKQQKAEAAKIRFEARQARLEAEKQERENRHKAASARRRSSAPTPDSDAVQAALARIKKAKPSAEGEQDMAALRAQRKAEARAAKAQKAGEDPKKAAVAAAIARAKAKQAQAKGDTSADNGAALPEDRRKAAVAAAIAKAKAKLAQAQGDTSADNGADPTEDRRKAAVAAAIAKAKAKQAQAKGDTSADNGADPTEDRRKAAVAAAIAKAKAKQVQAKGDTSADNEPAPTEDRRKAAVAAAIAKAKAKAKQAAEKDDASADNGAAPTEAAPAADANARKAAVARAIAKAKAKQAAAKEHTQRDAAQKTDDQ
ncbi:electron transport complex subunit RsxC [Ferrimonas sediminicola]|uniref:Ion-translocating oxidoreductase complex subunit C n=1 Tax=Ferrimonas sediminicola TaxID=2569538 RepID=A0A4U1BCG8_9GAMM|nr:electron transport complex subunit RsxC [Ferrimonas sediminicola]